MNVDTNIIMVTNPRAVTELKEALRHSTYAGLDVETTASERWYQPGFKLLTIAISTEDGQAFVIPCEHPHVVYPGFQLAVFKEIITRLDQQPLWIMQSGWFDWLSLASKGIELDFRWWDTQVAEYLITGDPQAKQSLVAIVKKYLGIDDWKDIDYSAPEEEDLQTLALLNGRDADLTRRLFLPLGRELLATGNGTLFSKLMMPAVYALTRASKRGLPVDLDRLERLEEETAEQLEGVLEHLIEETEHHGPWPRNARTKRSEFNPGSFKQVGRLLYDTLGLPVPKFTDKGAPSTDEESLLKIEHMHPMVELIMEYRKIKKFHSSSLVPWLEKSSAVGKLHPTFKPTQTRTGRLASEHPNIQQVPPEGKTVFGGVPNHKIVEIDYSQLELRIVAELAQEWTMLDAFHKGEDLHQITADLMGVDRKKGKVSNFGLLYGGGPGVLISEAKKAGVDITQSEAEYLRAKWFDTYTAIEEYHEQVIRQAHADRGVSSLIGRWRPLPDLGSGDYKKRYAAERQAINMPVQSLASDITLYQFAHSADLTILGRSLGRPIATVHDSIVLLVPDDCVEDVPIIQGEMEDLDRFNTTFGVDIAVPLKTDASIADYWG